MLLFWQIMQNVNICLVIIRLLINFEFYYPQSTMYCLILRLDYPLMVRSKFAFYVKV